MITRHTQGQLGFTEYVKMYGIFENEDWKSRLPLAFAVSDIDGDGIISPNDAFIIIGQLLSLYTGKPFDELGDKVERMVSELLWTPSDSPMNQGSPLSAFQLFGQNAPGVEPIRDFFMLEDSNLFKRLQSRGKNMFHRLSF